MSYKLNIVIFVLSCVFSCSEVNNKLPAENISRGHITATFLPDNNLHKQDKKDSYGQLGIAENEFNEVLDAIEQMYAPIFENHGARLVVNRFWDDSTVNAYAEQEGNNWIISMFGGLARRKEITKEGFALVACHEIGHHVGGYPFYSGQWASNEGNSDFYSAAACARMIFADSSPCSFIDEMIIDVAAKNQCSKRFFYGEDSTICQRTLAGGLSLGKLLATLGGDKLPRYETPDKTEVRKTQESHPRAQCRLDTYKAGAVCKNVWDNDLIPKSSGDMRRNSCPDRPKCWFAN